ncbi:DUF885 domain-containing protein [Cellulomonas endophytica]|uniref:DUF885 domain-containing protein n=1 Tax=Cellulomonas endophytica TaxID=2494735 RepID=UPI001010E7C0|nr:DUF885 domain-containing protein [Cellulomonas endophytica]
MTQHGVAAAGTDGRGGARRARDVADRWVETLARLDPTVATALGTRPDEDGLPDLSWHGFAARAAAARAALAELDGLPGGGASSEGSTTGPDDDDRRCGTLLRERLGTALALHEAGEDLAHLRPIGSPVGTLQGVFLLMPRSTPDEWAVVARRLARVPEAAASVRAGLEHGLATGHVSASRQADAVVAQLSAWLPGAGRGGADGSGAGWYADLVAGAAGSVPEALRRDLERGAAAATGAVAGLRDWLAAAYRPAVADVPDGVGAERWALAARQHLGAQVDPHEAHAWGWEELARIEAEMDEEAGRVLRPGATPAEAAAHLAEHGPAVDGEDAVRAWLQDLMDRTIAELDGTVVDVPAPVRRVEAMIAPPGSAAAPYYTRPSLDFARPGRTWLPTLGRTRFPTWDLVSTWYHEGVPGHHLQLGRWAHRAGELSRFQVSVGSVPATTEGWALYAERLMDELGRLRDAGERLGYLDGQRLRAVRVVVDTGMHLGLPVRGEDGARWTAGRGLAFLGERSGSSSAFVASEVTRYLGWPGQAVAYKLGERAWLAGRAAARARRRAAGEAFDLRAWHSAALGLGSLGLADLERELAAL